MRSMDCSAFNGLSGRETWQVRRKPGKLGRNVINSQFSGGNHVRKARYEPSVSKQVQFGVTAGGGCASRGLFREHAPLNAQILYGSITGTVSDKTGAVIPGVTVTITNQGTGESASLPLTDWALTCFSTCCRECIPYPFRPRETLPGATVKDIQVEVNRQVRVDITLQPATVSTQITVTEAPPMLQTETAEVNSEISQTQLSQMPMTSSQGRSFQALYTLIPARRS